MTEPTTPAPKPDLLAEAGKLLKRVSEGLEFISGSKDPADDQAIIIAAAVLAVAGELRDIHNVLVDVRDLLRGDIADMTSPAEFDNEVVVA